jgi:hypothetical protein
MLKKSQLIICILVIVTLSTTLCFGDDEKPKEVYEGQWIDLGNFDQMLLQNYPVTIRDESGSDTITAIDDPNEILYVSVGIDEPYSNLEVEALYNFVEAGGTLLVAADNNYHVNSLAQRFGIIYNDHAVINLTFDYNYTFIPLTIDTPFSSYLILIHSPLAIDITATDFEILAMSSGTPEIITSAINMNNNTKIDGEDIPGPIPLIVKVTINDGQAVFISDTGMFTDSLWMVESIDFPGRIYQNSDYILDLIYGLYPTDGRIIYDISKQKAGISDFKIYPPDKNDL